MPLEIETSHYGKVQFFSFILASLNPVLLLGVVGSSPNRWRLIRGSHIPTCADGLQETTERFQRLFLTAALSISTEHSQSQTSVHLLLIASRRGQDALEI